MSSPNELIWTGLGHLNHEQTLAVRELESRPGGPYSRSDHGPYAVRFYATLEGNETIVIAAGTRIVGIGIRWPHEEAAKVNLVTTARMMKRLGIPGTPSIWKLYVGPTRVG
jgi:hypothetical protein